MKLYKKVLTLLILFSCVFFIWCNLTGDLGQGTIKKDFADLSRVEISFDREFVEQTTLNNNTYKNVNYYNGSEIVHTAIVSGQVSASYNLNLSQGFVFCGWYDNPNFVGEVITAENLLEIKKTDIDLYKMAHRSHFK